MIDDCRLKSALKPFSAFRLPLSAFFFLPSARHSSLITRHLLLLLPLISASLCLASGAKKTVQYDGARWHVKGDGIVCCPCAVPCPCRTNSTPSYGHCEATLYLRIKQGHYGNTNLAGMQVIDTGGMCAVRYQQLSALYFDRLASPAQQEAYMKMVASFLPSGVASFPYVRVASFDSKIIDDRLFNISIPGLVEIIVDRYWGQPSPPMPMVAAADHFSNLLQYVQNIRYRIHDPEAGLDFDYSHRQANYRIVDVSIDQYRSKSLLIQFEDGKGSFNTQQLQIVKAEHLPMPQLEMIRKEALRLREARKQ
jgi:hypothetical protein